MAYRSDSKEALEWRKWLAKNGSQLDECGLPEIIIKDKAHWWDFLEHGFLDHHEDVSHFQLENLSGKQKRVLYDFLNADLSEDEKVSAIAFLRLKTVLHK